MSVWSCVRSVKRQECVAVDEILMALGMVCCTFLSALFAKTKEERIMENTARNYVNMEIKELIESIITDSKKAGTITYPLRTEGYHKCSNLLFTDRL